MNKPRFNLFSFLFNLLIDLVLIGMGAVLYYHFLVYPLAPVDLSPIVVNLFGNKQLAVLVVSGLPIVVGVFSFLDTISRLFRRPAPAKKTLVNG